ncbi:MAG: SigE family RNA polymerase sigma factor [Nocardioides sp.]|nr:SigE family RNA polymerase sigma factor [Nocardioidaceae bacterium]MCB8956004.1 SigE family RNA polymerase sigma factor [Nocardioides sp.]
MSRRDAERDSFEEYVAARRAALLRTAYLLTGHREDAEDLVQVALVKVVPRWGRIADDPEPYVRKVLVNESISRWRRRRWREVHTDTLPEPAVEGPGADRVALQQALARLAPRQRAVIVLRYYDDLTESQAARLLGVSVGTVKSQARDALRRLRELVPDLAHELEEVRR